MPRAVHDEATVLSCRRSAPFVAAVVVTLLVAIGMQACKGDGSDAGPPSPTIDPTYPRVAFIDETGNLAVISADGNGETALTEIGGIAALSVSPKGTEIALTTAGAMTCGSALVLRN